MFVMPTIDMVATGKNIEMLRKAAGISVKDLQDNFRIRNTSGNLQMAARSRDANH